jgi:hypothetical protein
MKDIGELIWISYTLFLGHWLIVENRFMPRPLAKSPFLLLAFSLWILACPASQSDDDEFNLLNQQVQTLFKQGKYQEAIPIAERAVEAAKRARGPEHLETADALTNLGFLLKKNRGLRQSRAALPGSAADPTEGLGR